MGQPIDQSDVRPDGMAHNQVKRDYGGEVKVTLSGSSVEINNANVKINNADVTKADVLATNGVVHIIDHVLIPPSTHPAPPAPSDGTFKGQQVAILQLYTRG